jgi:hypothetical protein
MAVVQLRNDTEGRRYYRRKLTEGKTTMEAMRALKRRLSDIVYRQMTANARGLKTGPGGHVGATLQSSAADPNPKIDTSDLSCSGLVTTPAEGGQEGSGLSGDAGLGGHLPGADGDGG